MLCWHRLFCRSVSRLVRIIEIVEITQDVNWWTRSPDISLLSNGLCYNNVIMQKAIRLMGVAITRARGVGRLNKGGWDSVLKELPRLMSGRTAEFVVLPNVINFFLVCLQLAIGYSFPILLVYAYLYDCHSVAVSDTQKHSRVSEHTGACLYSLQPTDALVAVENYCLRTSKGLDAILHVCGWRCLWVLLALHRMWKRIVLLLERRGSYQISSLTFRGHQSLNSSLGELLFWVMQPSTS